LHRLKYFIFGVFLLKIEKQIGYYLLILFKLVVLELLASSIKLFSNKLIKGTMIKKWAKYITVLICPNSINGDSTCLAPNCINIKKLPTNI
jgi:hypothetical protein